MNSILAAFAVAALATGCATSGYKQADKTGEGIASFRAEIVNLKRTVDDTMSLLGQTSETAATDPRKAFEAFSKSVARLKVHVPARASAPRTSRRLARPTSQNGRNSWQMSATPKFANWPRNERPS